MDAVGVLALREVVGKSGLNEKQSTEALTQLMSTGKMIVLGPAVAELTPRGMALVLSRGRWERLTKEIRSFLAEYHNAYPLRIGMHREELKSRLGFPVRAFNALIKHNTIIGELVEHGVLLSLPAHQVKFNDHQQHRINALLARFREDVHNTPSRKEAVAVVGQEVLSALLDRGTLLAVSADVLLLDETYAAMEVQVREQICAAGSVTVAGVRDLFGTSRKYALALLEHMDQKKITVRKGNERVLRY
jgi:selenocysteine-specific elongation factor